MTSDWRSHVPKLEDLARKLGLDWSPVIFEAVPDSFMTEIAVYGLPVRMPHWSFGARYIYQLLQRHMGYSRLFEVVFPGDPGHAYLAASNGLADNVLVAAHVLGHADFSKNNMLFRRCQEQGSAHIIEHAASHARQIERDIESHGFNAVEQVLDAALSLEQYVDLDQRLRRERYPEYAPRRRSRPTMRFARASPPRTPHPLRRSLARPARRCRRTRKETAVVHRHLCPEMESWERDIFLAVRDESFYFYPVFATQIMNEGWASYWHARLLREADFIPGGHVSRCHQVPLRRGAAGGDRGAGRPPINPYHLGFTLWEEIIKKAGIETARRIMREDDDFSFLRNHLTREMADRDGAVPLSAPAARPHQGGRRGYRRAAREPADRQVQFRRAARVRDEVRNDGTLVLSTTAQLDGRGLDAERSAQSARVRQAGLAASGAPQYRRRERQGSGSFLGVGSPLGQTRRPRCARRAPGYSRQTTSLAECARQLIGNHVGPRCAARHFLGVVQ
jgi:stage V sporulation protein R